MAKQEKQKDPNAKRAKEHLGAGIGLGVVSVCAAAAGAVCPLCVVAVPALIGSGLYHKHKSRQNDDAETSQNNETPLKQIETT